MEGEYYKNKSSVDAYIRLAKDVSGVELIEKMKNFLPTHSKLLEIGTGPGTDWCILKKDFEVTGSDYSKVFLNYLNSKHLNGRFLELDAVTLAVNETFDGIYSNKVMHHLTDDELTRSIARQSAILNADGVVCHSFWKGQGSEVFNGLFVNYHIEDTLRAFFAVHFDILIIESYKEFEEGDSLLLIGTKKIKAG